MIDILERLDTTWPADFELQPKTSAERKNVIEMQRLKADAADEIARLRVNEKASIATVRKWAAERVEMVDKLERLRKIEGAALTVIGCTECDTPELLMLEDAVNGTGWAAK